jgi:flagellar assembly factor FliW
LKLETLTFGTLEFEEKSILHIQEGMLGFPHLKQYILVEDPEIHPFKWLQSIDDLYVAFPVVDPHLLEASYAGSLSLDELKAIGMDNIENLVTMAVAVIADDPAQSTINLKAPLLINHQSMIGKQVVLADSTYNPWQPLLIAGGEMTIQKDESA